MRNCLLTLLVLLVWQWAGAQKSSVSGTVTGPDNKPLEGVTVTEKGTATASRTTTNGSYTIKVSGTEAVLVFSSIGYLEQELQVGNRSIINITMSEKVTAMDEIVIIGYGVQRKRDVTGSVSKVEVADLKKAPVQSFDQALAGRVSGVQVQASDGQPGSVASIVIRGSNSLTQDNSPLYVIDGFPLENPDNNMINPSDIESIEVLKDASATAIYGARGANGVILITTKSGKAGAPQIMYNGSYGFQQTIKTMPLLSGYEFIRYQLERDSVTAASLYLTNGKTLESYKGVSGTSWQDQLFRQAPMQDHNISLTGGTDKTQYALTGSLSDQDGLIVNSGFKRYQGRFALTQKAGDKLKVSATVNYSNTKSNGVLPASGTNSATNALLYSVWGYRPVSGSGVDLTQVLFDPDINGSNDYRINPILSAENELRRATTNSVLINSYAQYQFSKSLTLKISGGISNNLRRNDAFYNSNTFYGNPNSSGGVNGVNGSVIYIGNNSWLNENLLTYTRRFNRSHNLNLVGGVTFQGDSYTRYGSAAIQVPNESLGLSGLDEGVPQRVEAVSANSRLASFLSRINYAFRSKYLLTVSFRADGSSKFAPGNRWSYFPSGSFAWRLNNENFLKGVRAIQDAKIRIGYGVTGNNRVGDFSYLSVLGMPAGSPYAFNNAINLGAIPLALGNPDLRWESTEQANIGFDLTLFKERLSFSADAYRKITRDLLLNADLPFTTGYDNAFKNIGKVRNEGLEFSLNTKNIDNNKFKWTSGLNISFNRSKVRELSQNQEFMTSTLAWENSFSSTPLYIAQINRPMAQFYGYMWDGIYQLDDFDKNSSGAYVLKAGVPNNGNVRTTIQPGDIKYRDLNGDGEVNAKDLTVIGRGEPLHIGGFNNNLTYGSFDLNIFFQWSYGNDVFNANRLVFEGNILDKINLNQFAGYANRWTPENQSATLPRVGGQGPKVYSSRVIEDGSYLRLKTLSLGYNVSRNFLNRIRIKNLRLHVSAQNLITWTAYSGMDPEVSVRNSALTPGFDYSAYPRARTIVFGVSASF